MNYELAKELKDAGFPQEPSYHGSKFKEEGGGWVKCPTLSELIEACGEGFDRLDKLSSGWGARAYNKEHQAFTATGLTPEEAVARLWLALNKKEV